MEHKINFGYCCINTTLKERGIFTNRGMVKKTFIQRGLAYASELALLNIADLLSVLKWNKQHNIKLFRISSDLFPWMSEYEIKSLPNYNAIKKALATAGQYATDNGIRLTFHPGHFCVIASANEIVVSKSIKELNQHGEIMDLLGMPSTQHAAINIHINTTAIDKKDSMRRFATAFNMLDYSVRSRLTLENDDKKAQYSISDLCALSKEINVPIVFDYHHHICYDDPLPLIDALTMARLTWPTGVRQLVHYSSSRKYNEDITTKITAHADYIYEKIDTCDLELDVDIEAKCKELALFKYIREFLKN